MRSVNQSEPFFLFLAPFAPHAPSTPAPRHAGLAADVLLPRPPSFDESDEHKPGLSGSAHA